MPNPSKNSVNERPLLLVDVDGVISLFGFDPARPPDGRWETVDGVAHLLSAAAGACLRPLLTVFEAAWCTGWEEKANEYLPRALDLPGPLPYLSFDSAPRSTPAHWKLTAIDAFAAPRRPLAWIDDAFDDSCWAWAASRVGATLLVPTLPAAGITDAHVDQLLAWAERRDR